MACRGIFFALTADYQGEEYVVAHVLVDEVVQVAAALETVDVTWMRQRYDRIDPASYQGALRGAVPVLLPWLTARQ